MLRRLALIAALLGPATALAQTAGTVTVAPGVFGRSACGSTDAVTLSWTSAQTPVPTDVYRLFVATTACTSGTPTQWGPDVAASSATQSVATTKTDLLAAAGVTCPTTGNQTIYVCVQHWQVGGTDAKATASGTAKYEGLLPPVPVSVSVAPGDAALFVGWADGTGSSVKAVSYNVTAVAPGNPLDTRTRSSPTRSYRIDGLTNGVPYDVTVTAVSEGGNESAASAPPVAGTPQVVDDFWDQYVAANGYEKGGCAGGPAGALSLLGVALALRGLRRRS